MEKFLKNILRNWSIIFILAGVFSLALPIENYIPSIWLWPFVVVGSFGLILYFAIYFTYTRGN